MFIWIELIKPQDGSDNSLVHCHCFIRRMAVLVPGQEVRPEVRLLFIIEGPGLEKEDDEDDDEDDNEVDEDKDDEDEDKDEDEDEDNMDEEGDDDEEEEEEERGGRGKERGGGQGGEKVHKEKEGGRIYLDEEKEGGVKPEATDTKAQYAEVSESLGLHHLGSPELFLLEKSQIGKELR